MTAGGVLRTILAVSVSSAAVHGHMSLPEGVTCNLLTVDNRLLFTQADDGLTVLNIKTGAVVTRLKDRKYRGTLTLTEHGILMTHATQVVLLDRAELKPIWEVEHYGGTILSEGRVVINRLDALECRDQRDGHRYWSYACPSHTDIKLIGHRLVVSDGGYGGDKPMVAVLDFRTGRVLLRLEPPTGVRYGRVFIDGDRVYVERFAKGRPRRTFEGIWIWDISGKEIGAIKAPPELSTGPMYDGRTIYCLGNMTFSADGRVWPASEKEIAAEAETRAKANEDDLCLGDTVWTEQIPSGEVVSDTLYLQDRDWVVWIELRSSRGGWTGVLPYLESSVLKAAEAEGKLFIGTSYGHVECIDMATGKSLWVYVFPMLNRTASCSWQRGHPPRYAESAAAFRSWRPKARSVTGMRLLPPGVPLEVENVTQLLSPPHTGPKPAVILDPDPMNPLAMLPVFLWIAWSGALFPLACLTRSRGSKQEVSSSVGWSDARGLILLCVLWATLRWFGRVSLWSGLAMKASAIVVFCFVVWHSLTMFRQGRRVAPGIVLTVLGYITHKVLPLIRYC